MILVALLVALLVLVGGAAVVLVLLQARQQSGALGKKVDQAMGVDRAEQKKQAKEEETPAWVEDLSVRIRPILVGSGPTWGARSSTLRLFIYGSGAALTAIILFRLTLHLPLWLWVPIALAAFFLVPRVIVRQEQHRVEARFMAFFPDAIDMVVRMVRAGLPVTATMRTLGQRAAPPVDTVFAAVADQIEIGIPMEDALANMSERVGLADFRFFATAVSLQRATGGNLAVTLETLGEIIRKRRAIRMKANAATAEVRISAIVLSVIPFFITGALMLMAPSYLAPLITDPRGNVLVGIAILSLTLAGLTMRWLIRKATMT
ncbi:MAG TPA: type II secretion system F family protein [Alphaproteobacteria bacterium]|nr:type II secretion system F family protein [Alphaproteobacteria bacterium]